MMGSAGNGIDERERAQNLSGWIAAQVAKNCGIFTADELARLDVMQRRTLLHYEMLEHEWIRANMYALEANNAIHGARSEKWLWVSIALVAAAALVVMATVDILGWLQAVGH